MIPDSETFMGMLKNKEQVLQTILSDLDSCGKNHDAFEKLASLYEEGKPVDNDKAMKALSLSVKHLNDVNRKLLLILLVYASGDNYTTDCALVLNKMGRGREAMQAMFRAKMGG